MKQEIEFIKIDTSVVPKELFNKYGVKPFQIMKNKMRDENGDIWNNINFFDAQKEAKKLGYRLPDIREMLLLLDFYKSSNKKVSKNDNNFLGIEELSYSEDVYLEWVYCLEAVAFQRGGNWDDGAGAGAFTLVLRDAPSNTYTSIGFRCAW